MVVAFHLAQPLVRRDLVVVLEGIIRIKNNMKTRKLNKNKKKKKKKKKKEQEWPLRGFVNSDK